MVPRPSAFQRQPRSRSAGVSFQKSPQTCSVCACPTHPPFYTRGTWMFANPHGAPLHPPAFYWLHLPSPIQRAVWFSAALDSPGSGFIFTDTGKWNSRIRPPKGWRGGSGWGGPDRCPGKRCARQSVPPLRPRSRARPEEPRVTSWSSDTPGPAAVWSVSWDCTGGAGLGYLAQREARPARLRLPGVGFSSETGAGLLRRGVAAPAAAYLVPCCPQRLLAEAGPQGGRLIHL